MPPSGGTPRSPGGSPASLSGVAGPHGGGGAPRPSGSPTAPGHGGLLAMANPHSGLDGGRRPGPSTLVGSHGGATVAAPASPSSRIHTTGYSGSSHMPTDVNAKAKQAATGRTSLTDHLRNSPDPATKKLAGAISKPLQLSPGDVSKLGKMAKDPKLPPDVRKAAGSVAKSAAAAGSLVNRVAGKGKAGVGTDG
jgi:hypothetical protein